MCEKRDVGNYHCGNCKYFNVKADLEGVESTCKRIDHKKVKFYKPWFKSYDCNQHNGIICSDFIPADWCVSAVKEWRGFEEYWENYVEQWLPYRDTNTFVSFFVNGDTETAYRVRLMDFVNGTMIEKGILKAFEKMYYKRDRNPNGFGYKLVHEPINGIAIEA